MKDHYTVGTALESLDRLTFANAMRRAGFLDGDDARERYATLLFCVRVHMDNPDAYPEPLYVGCEPERARYFLRCIVGGLPLAERARLVPGAYVTEEGVQPMPDARLQFSPAAAAHTLYVLPDSGQESLFSTRSGLRRRMERLGYIGYAARTLSPGHFDAFFRGLDRIARDLGDADAESEQIRKLTFQCYWDPDAEDFHKKPSLDGVDLISLLSDAANSGVYGEKLRVLLDAAREQAEASGRALTEALRRNLTQWELEYWRGRAEAYREQIRTLTDEKTSLEKKLSEQKAAYEQRITEQKAAYERRIAEQQTAYEQRIAEQQTAYEQRMAQQKAAYERQIAELSKENERLKQESQRLPGPSGAGAVPTDTPSVQPNAPTDATPVQPAAPTDATPVQPAPAVTPPRTMDGVEVPPVKDWSAIERRWREMSEEQRQKIRGWLEDVLSERNAEMAGLKFINTSMPAKTRAICLLLLTNNQVGGSVAPRDAVREYGYLSLARAEKKPDKDRWRGLFNVCSLSLRTGDGDLTARVQKDAWRLFKEECALDSARAFEMYEALIQRLYESYPTLSGHFLLKARNYRRTRENGGA